MNTLKTSRNQKSQTVLQCLYRQRFRLVKIEGEVRFDEIELTDVIWKRKPEETLTLRIGILILGAQDGPCVTITRDGNMTEVVVFLSVVTTN